jgi:hypothetical protein
MRTILRCYEPVFGGIVAILAAALLCFVLFVPSPGRLDGPTVYLMWYSGAGVAWGLVQVIGYRSAKRKGIPLEEPVLSTALGCVLLGLMFALVTVCVYEFAHNTWYAFATGLVTVALLCIGAIVGIREGTWK